MHYLTLNQALEIYRRIGLQSGGAVGILNLGGLKSALAQPYMTFDGKELYPTLVEKAAAVGFSVIQNHPFVDGNKRAGHAMMAMLLELNGYEIQATVNEQVTIIMQIASGELSRAVLCEWLQDHVKPK
jgi:death on curing protein